MDSTLSMVCVNRLATKCLIASHVDGYFDGLNMSKIEPVPEIIDYVQYVMIKRWFGKRL